VHLLYTKQSFQFCLSSKELLSFSSSSTAGARYPLLLDARDSAGGAIPKYQHDDSMNEAVHT
jgi:hypothetical protein